MFKALANNDYTSAINIAEHIKSTRHNIDWDHFEISLASGKSVVCYTAVFSVITQRSSVGRSVA